MAPQEPKAALMKDPVLAAAPARRERAMKEVAVEAAAVVAD